MYVYNVYVGKALEERMQELQERLDEEAEARIGAQVCCPTTECVLLLQNVSSYYRMCSLTTECVLLLQNVFSYYRMCSLTIEGVR